MTAKRVVLGAKPTKTAETADAWVQHREPPKQVPLKRLTIDLPLSLHNRFKAGCAARNMKMADEIREFLEQKYGNQ